jgi:hypothetical protein
MHIFGIKQHLDNKKRNVKLNYRCTGQELATHSQRMGNDCGLLHKVSFFQSITRFLCIFFPVSSELCRSANCKQCRQLVLSRSMDWKIYNHQLHALPTDNQTDRPTDHAGGRETQTRPSVTRLTTVQCPQRIGQHSFAAAVQLTDRQQSWLLAGWPSRMYTGHFYRSANIEFCRVI